MNKNSFILGTVQFGLNYGINNTVGKPSKENVFEILHFAHDTGIEYLDCADAYGDAYQTIGDFIESTGKIFNVNTKFHVDKQSSIIEQLDASLRQLHIDQIQTYFFHRFEDIKTQPKSFDELNRLKEAKKILKIGVSVYSNEDFAFSINHPEVDVIQFPYNLLDNSSKRGKLINQAKEMGKELHVRSVFLQGLFFKATPLPIKLRPLEKYIDQLKRIAEIHKLSMFDLALGYVLAKKELDNIIIGIDSKDQLIQNLNCVLDSLDISLVQAIDDICVAEESLLYPYNWS